MDPRPQRCPRCDSYSPEKHPAVQEGGEVQPCTDPWHDHWPAPGFPAPEPQPAKPVLTIRVHRRPDTTDVWGQLLDPDPNSAVPLWGHVSSNDDLLRGDLTTTFTARREALAQRFPDGYEVVLVEAASNEEAVSP